MKTVLCNTCKHRDDLNTDSCALCYPDLEALGNYEFNSECDLCLFSTRRDRIKEIKNETIDKCIELARAEIDFESQAEQRRFVEFMEQLKEK